jgi:hypothetical protein
MNTITDCLKFKMKLDILKCIRIFLLKIETKPYIAVATYRIFIFCPFLLAFNVFYDILTVSYITYHWWLIYCVESEQTC